MKCGFIESKSGFKGRTVNEICLQEDFVKLINIINITN